MTLPVSGAISLSDVNVELNKSSTALISMNDSDARYLAGVPSGQISMSNFYGKTYAASVSYQGTFTSNSSLSSYTYTSAPIGTASSTRTVIVGVVYRSGSGVTSASVTVGSTAATQIASTNPTTGVYLFTANVPSGTTANITASLTGSTPSRAGIHVWAAYDLINPTSPTAIVYGSQTRPTVLNSNVTKGSIGVCVSYNNDSTTFTYVGLTKNFDSYVSGGSFTCASENFAVTETPRTMSVTCADTGPIGFVTAFAVLR